MLKPSWQGCLLFLAILLGLGSLYQLLLCLLSVVCGLFIVLYVVSEGRTFNHLRGHRQPIRQPRRKPLEDEAYYIETELSGYVEVDQELNKLIQLVLRDYVMHWHAILTHTNHFPAEVHNVLVTVTRTIVKRLKNVDWVAFVTNRILDEVSEHIRLFKIASESASNQSELVSAFFDAEAGLLASLRSKSLHSGNSNETANKSRSTVCRDAVCTSTEEETVFVSDVVEVILFLLMPKEQFDALGLRLLVREIVVHSIMKPSLELVSEPDFVNQTIIWLYGDRVVKPEYFLQVIRCSDSVEELSTCNDRVSREISLIRTQDSKLDSDSSLKAQLESLLSLQQTIELRIGRLKSPRDSNDDEQSLLSVDKMDWSERVGADLPSLFALPAEVVLKNNIALSYFVDFMTSVQCQHYVFFYLNVEGWRMSSAQQLQSVFNEGNEDVTKSGLLNGMRESAHAIYSEYLKPSSDNYIAAIEEGLCRRLLFRIRTETPDPQWFDETQSALLKVIEEDECLLKRFRNTVGYVKLLAELDLLNVHGEGGQEQSQDEPQSNMEVDEEISNDDDKAKCIEQNVVSVAGNTMKTKNSFYEANETSSPRDAEKVERKHSSSTTSLSEISHDNDDEEDIYNNNREYRDDEDQSFFDVDQTEATTSKTSTMSSIHSHKRSCSDGAKSVKDNITLTSAVEESPSTEDDERFASSSSTLLRVSVVDVEVSRDWKGKALAYYKIVIQRQGTKEVIKRRYSDFYALHERILASIEDEDLKETLAEFPCKKAFGNMDKELLLKRKTMFDAYLKRLLEHSSNRTLSTLISHFLTPNGPLRRSATSSEMSVPQSIQQRSKVKLNLAKALNKVDNFKGGITKAFHKPSPVMQGQQARLAATLQSSMTTSQSSLTASSSSTLHASLLSGMTPAPSSSSLALSYDDEADSSPSNVSSNIPLRIISVLLDEIFELRTRHAWLRRQSMAMLKQLLAAMFGDIFHRRFLDNFNYYTSSTSLAQCLKSIREALWPQGYPAQYVERESSVKDRTRLTAKAVLFSWLPDDLRRVIGSETTRVGLLNLFDMIQHPQLNKRLCFVVIEALIDVVFPAVGFKSLVSKMHSKRSSRSNNNNNNENSGDKGETMDVVDVLKMLRQGEQKRSASWTRRSANS